MRPLLLLLLLLLAALPACAGRQVDAPRGAHPPNGAVSVPYPPPPAKVEELPPRPSAACAWVDGYWEFTDRWEWQPGEWIIPQAHCRLAPMELRRQAGVLLHARPRWYPDNVALLGPQSACPRPPACSTISARPAASSQPER